MDGALRRARVRVAAAERALAAAEQLFDESSRRYYSLPVSERGWPIELVYASALTAFVVEWYPSWSTAFFFIRSRSPQLGALTAVFAATGVVLGVVIGELLRRYRKEGRPHPLVEKIFLVFTCVMAASYLVVAYNIHLSFILPPGGLDPTSKHILIAVTLTMLMAMGIALVCVAGYYREAFFTARVRRPLREVSEELANLHTERDAAIYAFARLDALVGAVQRLAKPLDNAEANSLPVEITENIEAATRELDVQFRGEREGYLFFKRIDAREPLNRENGLRKAKEIVDAIRSTGSDDARAALERHRGVRLG